MSVKLLTEHSLEFLSLKGGWLSMSKCHIVGNHMSRLNYCVDRGYNTTDHCVLKHIIESWHVISNNVVF